MKGIVKVEIEIPVEYDELSEERVVKELKEYFNGKYNKSSYISCHSTEGFYSWKLSKKNAKAELVKI